ncbi:hypothetical protein LOC51_08645 [Rubrivivax sp. JA1024]|nr:hypothetical protein [Rubrivivax sp. JA1024]
MTARIGRIAFRRIAEVALTRTALIVPRWLPDGRREGHEWVARNPTRNDHKLGSFKVNMNTGRWGDFAADASGGDLISLAAYLYKLSNRDAALKVAEMLGVNPYE